MVDDRAKQQSRGKGAALRAHLLGLIEAELAPHARLPTERELAENFGVTRVTVRRALDKLGHEGRVYRTQGAGTFVAEPRIAKSVELTSFTEDMRARGLVPGSRETHIENIPAGAEIGARLSLSPRDPVTHIFRVRTADGAPLCIEHTYIPARLAPELATAALEGSLYQLLAETYHLKVEKAEQTIRATVLDRPEARLLEVPEFSPAFKVQRVAYDARNQRIEYAESVYRADRYSYDFVIYRSGRSQTS
jgi:GntR family transcriptional regulator